MDSPLCSKVKSVISSVESSLCVNLAQKGPKIQLSARKIMATLFWVEHGILSIHFLETAETDNNNRNLVQMVALKDQIVNERSYIRKKKVVFHEDNPPDHEFDDNYRKNT